MEVGTTEAATSTPDCLGLRGEIEGVLEVMLDKLTSEGATSPREGKVTKSLP